MSASSTTSPPAIRFGTDGWRALIAREYTFANLERVAQAYALYITRNAGANSGAPPVVIVGYDRRFMSAEFARRAGEVLAGNNIDVRMFDSDVPSQLVSWAVRESGAAGGVMITASHNPPQFNGFKIKATFGGSAPPETTREVESLVDVAPPLRRSFTTGDDKTARYDLAAETESYRNAVASFVDLERIQASDATVVIDSMHGTGDRWIEGLLSGGKLRVETIRAERDPMFGGVNPEPIDLNLGALKDRVKQTGALVGLATDGDADRLGAVNDLGATMTMHEVVPLLLLHLARVRGLTGSVVRTFSQSVLTRRIAEAHNLKVYETPIGFKYIADIMLREEVLIGAEESGGIGVRGHIPERDGILNSLLLLEAITTAGKTPSQMVAEMHEEFGAFHFDRIDLHMEVARGQQLVRTLAADPPARVAADAFTSVETMDGTKLLFGDESWLLFRQSGTEPALRIYAEATSPDKTRALLEAGRDLART